MKKIVTNIVSYYVKSWDYYSVILLLVLIIAQPDCAWCLSSPGMLEV